MEALRKKDLVTISEAGSDSSQSDIFEVDRLSGSYVYAHVVGTRDGDRYVKYNTATVKEKKNTTPVYFDHESYQFSIITIEVIKKLD